MKSFICTLLSFLILVSSNAQKSNDFNITNVYAKNDLTNTNYKYISIKENISFTHYSKLAVRKSRTKKRRNIKVTTERGTFKILNDSIQSSLKTNVDSNYTIKSTFDSSANNSNCIIKYSLSRSKDYKYNMHVEGLVSDCSEKVAIPHAYISLNSAVVSGKYMIVPTSIDGKFKVDVDDDSIGSITVIKKGYSERKISLNEATQINENTSYKFNLCLNKEVANENKIGIKNIPSTSNDKALVYFGFNKVTLQKSTRNILDSLIKTIKTTNSNPTFIDLNGYADSKGARKYNIELSRKRALACRRYLNSHGLTHIKIKVHAFGSFNPIEKEKIDGKLDNPIARAQNRRVEIVVH